MSSNPPERRYDCWAWISILLWAVVALLYVFYGRYVEDEGWYSLISREVWQGKMLYRDLRFTQMPLLPYLYGAFFSLAPPRLEVGRLVSFGLCLSGILACFTLTRARYGAKPAFWGVILLLLNRAFPYDGTNIKTQPLSFALVAWSLFFLARLDQYLDQPRLPSPSAAADQSLFAKAKRHAALAGLLLGASVITRLSLLPVLFLYPIFLWVRFSSPSVRAEAQTLLRLGTWAAWLPFLGTVIFYSIIAGDRFFFGIWGFHSFVGQNIHGWENLLRFIRGIGVDSLPWTLTVLIAAFLLGRIFLFHPHLRDEHHTKQPWFELFVLLTWLLCSVIHATRRPAYYVYQMTLAWAPLILGSWAASLLIGKPPVRWLKGAALMIGGLSLATLPWQDGWMHFSGFRTPAGVCQLAQPLRATPGKTLAGFDSGLAFCAPEITLLPGYELGTFSLVSPPSSSAQEHFRGISPHQLLRDLEQQADYLAIRQQNLFWIPPAARKPVLKQMKDHFEVLSYTPRYGQFNDALLLGRRKK